MTERPWGSFIEIDEEPRFKVKKLIINPGGILSKQKHLHRAEHWVIVQGTAKITVNEVESIFYENQSVSVPQFAIHRLENPGKIPLIIIETQTGSYLGEDDIIRLEDFYGRDNGR